MHIPLRSACFRITLLLSFLPRTSSLALCGCTTDFTAQRVPGRHEEIEHLPKYLSRHAIPLGSAPIPKQEVHHLAESAGFLVLIAVVAICHRNQR